MTKFWILKIWDKDQALNASTLNPRYQWWWVASGGDVGGRLVG